MDEYYKEVEKLKTRLKEDCKRTESAVDEIEGAIRGGATGNEILGRVNFVLSRISIEMACEQRKTRALLKKVRKLTRKLLP